MPETTEKTKAQLDEEFYDKEVAPELARLAQKCIERKMAFLAMVEYDPPALGSAGRPTWMTTPAWPSG
jgi:hypothetical protein